MLRDPEGNRVVDWETATKVAKSMSKVQRKRRNRLAAEYFGARATGEHTIADLFERRHDDLGAGWTPKYAKSRDLRKAFWIERFGKDTPLVAVNAAAVERVAREAQGEWSDRWRQDVLRYMVDSFSYAERKLKWIDAKHNLSAVTIPAARGASKAYTLAEAKAVVAKLWKIDARAGWVASVAFQTGRRIGAIRVLTKGDVTTEGELTVLRFAGATDKARRTGESVAAGLPKRTDWRPMTYDECLDWLRAAEKAAEVPYVSGRGFHGLKRLYATLTTGMAGADRQSGTRKETLEGHYRQDILEPKAEVARALAARLE